MGTMLATLGFTPKKILDPVKAQSDVDKLVVFHGTLKSCTDALDAVHQTAAKLGIKCVPYELPDSFDIIKISKFMSQTIKELESKQEIMVSFNVSGGTAVMSAAGMLVAIIHGIPMVYRREDTGETVLLPFLKMDFQDVLTKREHELLKILQENKALSLNELAAHMKRDKSTLSQQVDRMQKKGLVMVERGEDRRKVVIKPAPITELLVNIWTPPSS